MTRTIIATALAVAFAAAGLTGASARATTTLIAAEPGKALTIGAAKKQVDAWLANVSNGHLRAGDAEFDGQGNVKVTVIDAMGLPRSHVVVHAADQTITDAHTGAVLHGKG